VPFPFDQVVLGPSLAVFGESVTYTPTGGQAVTLTGIFDAAYQVVEFQEGAPVSTVMPVLGVRLSDFAAAPLQGDAVVIRGASYAVKDVEPDGKGGAKLKLQLAA
jgi:hypothetical protein